MKPSVPAVCSRFHRAIELIGGRWTGAVLQILLRGPTRYADIRSAIPDISDRMLSDRLRTLESQGIVERKVLPVIPVRVEYELTEKGRSLERALDAIARWAENWIPIAESDQTPAVAGDTPHISEFEAAALNQAHRPVAKPRIKPRISP